MLKINEKIDNDDIIETPIKQNKPHLQIIKLDKNKHENIINLDKKECKNYSVVTEKIKNRKNVEEYKTADIKRIDNDIIADKNK